jgi:hypothetical protein
MKTRNTGILEGWNNGLKQKNKTKNPFFFSTLSFFLFFPSIPLFHYSNFLTFWGYPQENVEKLWNWIPHARRSAESTGLPNK